MYQSKRPGPVTACAVLFFLIGGLGLLFNLCGFAGLAFIGWLLSQIPPPQPGAPDLQKLVDILFQRLPNVKYIAIAALSIAFILCLIEVIAGVGLMKMRYWGRR